MQSDKTQPLLGAADPVWRASVGSEQDASPPPPPPPPATKLLSPPPPATLVDTAAVKVTLPQQAQVHGCVGRALQAVVIACCGPLNFGYVLGFSSLSERW